MTTMLELIKQRKTSQRYYLFEDVLWELPGFAGLKRTSSIANLQLYAGYIWAREGDKRPCPTIRLKHTADWSEYLPDSHTIRLARKHRNLGGLLHELAHALGPHDKLTHGPAFRKRCTHLYTFYGNWDGRVDWDDKR